ncbi:DNA primase [Candidatus Peregrinibacteria bacterium]|nr:DNA primase [Candidatus Peregrinibacteria bacterium]
MIDIVSEIKARLNIEDIVGQYVQLKKAGRNLKGLCPFHQEKTPSFMVSPDKQIAYCFGCHKGGDLFKFIQEVEGVEFKDAIKILADKAGIDPSEYQVLHEGAHSKSEKEELFEIHRKSARFYVDYLWNSDEGVPVLEYLRNRGLTDESIKNFEIGLSPDSFDKTHLFLVKSGFSRNMIALSGMAISKDTRSENVYDRFRARLMFPIYDAAGRITGFGGRALKHGDEPKYLNSPDSPVYKKSEVLYGYNFAKDSVKKAGSIILVEGYFDVIMSHQAGAKNTAATSGTALTIQQIKLLKRATSNLLFCFDTDKAGIDAAKRGFELAENEGLNVGVICIPDAKDPADYVLEHKEKWLEVINENIPFMEFSINDVLKRYDLNIIEQKKQALKELLNFLSLLNSNFEKDHYVREIAHKLDVKEIQIYDELKKLGSKQKFEVLAPGLKNTAAAIKFSLMDLVFGLVYEYPQVLENSFKNIKENELLENEKSIYNQFKDNYNLLTGDLRKDFLLCFKEDFRARLELISLFIEDLYGNFTEEMVENEFNTLLEKIRKIFHEREKRAISYELKEAERNGNKAKAKELLEKFTKLVSF